VRHAVLSKPQRLWVFWTERLAVEWRAGQIALAACALRMVKALVEVLGASVVRGICLRLLLVK
jgi:hypothetical protein